MTVALAIAVIVGIAVAVFAAHRARSAQAAKPLTSEQVRAKYGFTGNCPVRQRTGDGASVGRCWHSTYGGICPSHGNVSAYLTDPDTGRCTVDENDLPPREQRDFGPPDLRTYFGVKL
jgi:hypothetical protein